MGHLLAHMSRADTQILLTQPFQFIDYLVEHINYAYKVKWGTKWGANITYVSRARASSPCSSPSSVCSCTCSFTFISSCSCSCSCSCSSCSSRSSSAPPPSPPPLLSLAAPI